MGGSITQIASGTIMYVNGELKNINGGQQNNDFGNDENQWINPDGSINYPPNNGAVQGTQKIITMQSGSTFGRYGKPSGTFGTQTGTTVDKLSLPPNSNVTIYHEYQVIKPIPNVEQSVIAPWGGSPGGGLQYKFPMSIESLENAKYIILIK